MTNSPKKAPIVLTKADQVELERHLVLFGFNIVTKHPPTEDSPYWAITPHLDRDGQPRKKPAAPSKEMQGPWLKENALSMRDIEALEFSLQKLVRPLLQ